MQTQDVLIIGGGAAGFFTAINAAEMNPGAKITILERGNEVLTKVRISGGGRCNVTHAEFLPQELIKSYPRGSKELRGPFHTFMTGDVILWFEERGVELKIEEDGRMFPISDSSETIINCFLTEAARLKINVLKNHAVKQIDKIEEGWHVETNKGDFSAKNIVIATGSNPKMWNLLKQLGHEIIPPVPSLFTFNIKDDRINALPGIATHASVKVVNTKLETEGPLLITHWGFSGPAVLKLSAWGARELHLVNYRFEIEVNWLPENNKEEIAEKLKALKIARAKKVVFKNPPFDLPKRLWQKLVAASCISEESTWADLNKEQLRNLADQLGAGIFAVTGKSTFKEEFVTAGGVALKEVDFKTFRSKLHQRLFFAGEVLNIDAVTGGFNFQAAWTGGFIVAKALLNE